MKKWDFHEEEKELNELDKKTLFDRCKRLEFIKKTWGRKSNYVGALFAGHAVYYFYEAKSDFINGNFVSCILIIQSFFEETLKGILSIKNFQFKYGFKDLIIECRKRNLISDNLMKDLNKLRNIRNPYVHNKNPMMILKFEPSYNPLYGISSVEEDAKFAIRVLFSFMRNDYHSEGFFMTV